MKKSPFSTPRGYGGYRKYSPQMHSPYANRGHFHQRNNSFDGQSPKSFSKYQENDDFIPFNTSSPSSSYNQRNSGQFFKSRGGRNNSFGSQGSYDSNMSSKFYFDSSPTNTYNRTPQHRFSNSRRSIPIDEIPMSQFFDIKDVLEDPWKDLMENYNKSKTTNKLNVSKMSSASDLNDKSTLSVDKSALENSSKCLQEIENDKTNTMSDVSTSEKAETRDIESKVND